MGGNIELSGGSSRDGDGGSVSVQSGSGGKTSGVMEIDS